ncbi:unnamed protein product, partial [Polarella glacialis]
EKERSSNGGGGGFELNAALKDRVNRPRKHAEEMAAAASAPVLALTDGSDTSGGVAAAAGAPALPASLGAWQPLGFGPPLRPDQFGRWQQTLRSFPVTSATWGSAKAQFEDWQRQVREAGQAAAPPRDPFGRDLAPHGYAEPQAPLGYMLAPGPPPGYYPGAAPPFAGVTAAPPGGVFHKGERADRDRKRARRREQGE